MVAAATSEALLDARGSHQRAPAPRDTAAIADQTMSASASGTRTLWSTAAITSPSSIAEMARPAPQPGQGIPVSARRGQGGSGSPTARVAATPTTPATTTAPASGAEVVPPGAVGLRG